MNYQQAVSYLYEQLPMFHRVGAAAYKADLKNTVALCNRLSNPQDKFPAIHVAGTNGKGSVCHMLASILQEAGLKTGLFTSPHLKDFRERIRIDGKMIPRSDVTGFISRNKPALAEIKPSFFEMTFCLGMTCFASRKIDIGVIEVGMGGRLDSTNLVRPLVSAITNISRDHTRLLGDSLPAIAREKAGIIKPGIPVVIGQTQDETSPVFLNVAEANGSTLHFADQDYYARPIRPASLTTGRFRYEIGRIGIGKIMEVVTPLGGIYQQYNLVTLFGVLDILRDNGYPLPEEAIRKGISNVRKNTGFSGRWQVLQKKPAVICDTGHNPDGISQVLQQVKRYPYRTLRIALGMVSDKDIGEVLSILPADAVYYFCKADIPRGMDAGLLKKEAMNFGLKGNAFGTVKDALNAAISDADPDDLVLVTGSIFVVAEVL